MKTKKARTAAIVVVIALVIALSGTFAWQSISQMARNEATEPTNPGGRLHDDFSGYGATDTKDIYVENFGNQPIYARVRLDEYMEIGEGAGLRGTVDADGNITRNPDNQAVSLVTGAELDDVTTWTTHIPGDAPNVGAETDFADPSKTFHTYWTWTMGGQDTAGNPDGKTVYMPTFNKNRDSLKADINGTLAGKDKDPAKGEQYDDYVKYTGTDTADRVRDEDTDTYPNGATYDIDADTTDECGPYGGAGGTGLDGINYGMKEETHKARETMSASVITMEEYMGKTDAQKADFTGWVYDKDGWAYWSQPIQPGTPTEEDEFATNATGLLLDRVYLEHKPSDAWYYSINAVGQFITADDLGRTDTTGFYNPNGGPAPSEDALTLLDLIGVDTASVKGAITPSVSVIVNGEAKRLTYAVQGMDLALSSEVTVADTASPSQNVTWTVSGNTDEATVIRTDARSVNPVLHVGENEDGPLTLVARSTTYEGLKGTLTLIVQPVSYNVTVTPDENAAAILPGGTQGFTATLTSNNPALTLPQTFTWELDGTYVSGTTITPADDTSKATLAVAELETARAVTVKATPTDPTYASLSATAAIRVTKVTYMVDIQNGDGTSVAGQTVTIKDGQEVSFNKMVSSYPTGQIPTDNWTWSSNNEANGITVENGTVSVAFGTATGTTATITVKNSDYDPAPEASFEVSVQERNYTVTVSPSEATVYPGKTQEFTATVTADSGTDPADDVTWSVSGNDDDKTKFEDNVLTVGADETRGGTLTVTATHASGATKTAVVTVATPTFTAEIQDSASRKVTTAEILATKSATFKAVAKPSGSTPTDLTLGATWTWSIANDTSGGKISVNNGTVSVASGATPGKTATITATSSKDSNLRAQFTVKVKEPGPEEATQGAEVTVDGIKFIVLEKGTNNVTGSDRSTHSAALLISKDILGKMAHNPSNVPKWSQSNIRKYLNSEETGNYTDPKFDSGAHGWLTDHPTIKEKAIQVTLKTRESYNSSNMEQTDDKVFLLSSADMCDKYHNGSNWVYAQTAEYTNGARLSYFGTSNENANETLRAAKYNGKNAAWWLRNPSMNATYVAGIDDYGGLTYRVSTETTLFGVRPAFWYKLD